MFAISGKLYKQALQCSAQSTVGFPFGGHVNVLSDYKETLPEKMFKIAIFNATAVMPLIYCSKYNFVKIISQTIKIHACFSASSGSCKKKWLKIHQSPTTLWLARVITLQIHHSTESTSMSALLYSFHT